MGHGPCLKLADLNPLLPAPTRLEPPIVPEVFEALTTPLALDILPCGIGMCLVDIERLPGKPAGVFTLLLSIQPILVSYKSPLFHFTSSQHWELQFLILFWYATISGLNAFARHRA